MLGRESDVWVSIVFAVSLHAIIVVILTMSWEWSLYQIPSERPKAIEARLIAPEPVAQTQPQQRRERPRPSNPDPAPVRAQPEPQRQPDPTPSVVAEPDPEPTIVSAPKAPPAQREMRDDLSLDEALSVEDEAFQELSEEEQAASKESTMQLMFARQIATYWSRPPSARNGMEVVIRIQLVPSGEVVNITLVRESGDPAFDRSAVDAIRQGAPYEFVLQFGQAFFNERIRTTTFVFRPEDLK